MEKNLTVCLICQETLEECDPTVVTAHVCGIKHVDRLKQLFYRFIPNDPDVQYNDSYTKLASNSVFDLSIVLGNETRYVHCYEDYIVCMVCQDIICDINVEDDTVENVFGHVQSEQHSDHIKHGVSLVYQLKTLTGFLMFNKTATFCSVCDKVFLTLENDTLQSAVNHLLTEHPSEVSSGNDESDESDKSDESNDDSFGSPRRKESKTPILGSWEEDEDNMPNQFIEFNRISQPKYDFINENKVSVKKELANANKINPFIITLDSTEKIDFCVVCKDAVNIRCEASSHILTVGHKENLESLKFQCTPDPFSCKTIDKYNELVSVLNNEKGCVSQCEEYLKCVICENTITKITQSLDTVKYDLQYHFGSKQHIHSMQSNAWWFYYLNFGDSFIAFDNHVSNCIHCSSYLTDNPDKVVKCAQVHLVAEGHILFDSKDEDDDELICSVCKAVVDIFNDDPEFSMNLHLKKHEDLSLVNHYFDLQSNMENFVPTCSKCLEEIVIFNNDIKLSLSLHECKAVIHQRNSKEYFEGGNKNINNKNNNCSISTTNQDPSQMLVDCNSVKTHFNNNLQYLEKGNIYFMCHLCYVYFVYFDEEDMINNFSSHCLSTNHSNNLKKEKRSRIENNCKSQILKLNAESIANHSNDCHIRNDFNPTITKKDIDLKKFIISFNRYYIFAKDNDYFCDICQTIVKSRGKIESQLKGHCYSVNHNYILMRNAVRYREGLCSTMSPPQGKFLNLMKMLAKDSYEHGHTTTFHLFFIDYVDNNFFCCLCDVKIKYTPGVLYHCKSKKHCINVSKLCCIYRSPISQENSLAATGSNTPNECFNSHVVNPEENCPKPVSSIENKIVTTIFTNSSYEPIQEINNLNKNSSENTINLPPPNTNTKLLLNEDDFIHCEIPGSQVLEKYTKRSVQCHQEANFHYKNPEDYVGAYNSEKHQIFNFDSTSTSLFHSENQDPWKMFERNEQYLEKRKVSFKCHLCDVYFIYFNDTDMTNTFSAHCLTSKHTNNLKRMSGNIEVKYYKGDILKLNAESIAKHSDVCHHSVDGKQTAILKHIYANKTVAIPEKYEKDNEYFCDICQEQVKLNGNKKNNILKNHFLSDTHNYILMSNAVKFREELSDGRTLILPKKLENVLKVLAENSYKNGHTITAHLFFIDLENYFFCCLCQKKIPFSPKGISILGHCSSKTHSMNVSKLCCIYRSLIPQENTFVKKELSLAADSSNTSNECSNSHNIVNPGETCLKSVNSIENTTVTNVNCEPNQENTTILPLPNTGTKLLLNEDCLVPCETPGSQVFEKKSYVPCLLENKFHCENYEDYVSAYNDEPLDTKIEQISQDNTTKSKLLLDEEFLVHCKTSGSQVLEKKCNVPCLLEDKFRFENYEDYVSAYDDESLDTTMGQISQVNNVNSISKNLKINEEYYCHHCHKFAEAGFNENTKYSFETNLMMHKIVLCNKHFLEEIYECLPSFQQCCKGLIYMKNDTIYCRLCNSTVKTWREDIFETAVTLYFHLTSQNHNIEALQSSGSKAMDQSFSEKSKVNVVPVLGIPLDVEVEMSSSSSEETNEMVDKIFPDPYNFKNNNSSYAQESSKKRVYDKQFSS